MMIFFLLVIGNKWKAPTVAVFQPVADTVEKNAFLSFPAPITGTPLILESIASYDGAYMEDDSGSEVTNVVAVLLRNACDRWIRSAEITLFDGKKELRFFVEELPPGQSALVPERRKQLYDKPQIYDVNGVCEYYTGEINDHITAKVSENALYLTNRMNKDAESVRIYYKTVYADGLFYVGGKTYVFVVPKLAAGDMIYLQPPYLAGEYSRILRIEYKRSSVEPPTEDLHIKELWRGNPAILDDLGS